MSRGLKTAWVGYYLRLRYDQHSQICAMGLEKSLAGILRDFIDTYLASSGTKLAELQKEKVVLDAKEEAIHKEALEQAAKELQMEEAMEIIEKNPITAIDSTTKCLKCFCLLTQTTNPQRIKLGPKAGMAVCLNCFYSNTSAKEREEWFGLQPRKKAPEKTTEAPQ